MASLTASTTRALARLSLNSIPRSAARVAAIPTASRVAYNSTSSTNAAPTAPTATETSTSTSTQTTPTTRGRTKRGSRRNSKDPADKSEPDALALLERTTPVKVTYKDLVRLEQIGWLSENQASQVAGLADQPKLPGWAQVQWNSFRDFRAARARLWVPSFVPSTGPQAESGQEWLDASVEAKEPGTQDVEGVRDEILADVWKNHMSREQRSWALIEARFLCLRKLGWRKGYSAGYPATSAEVDLDLRKEVIAKTANKDEAAFDAMADLQDSDMELAWKAWLNMTPEQRRLEERDAWGARDRTYLYQDDTPGKLVAWSQIPRWYETPQRAGNLVFLPNFTLRMVRNHTPPGQPYDPWKATFRAPLNLHKHAVRSFLLAVYGLRTTWIRSMVYRSALIRNEKRQIKTGSKKTYKKIEVGLLEPFVFPAISEKTKQDELFASEYELMQARSLMRARQRTFIRWRGGTPLPHRKPEARLEPWEIDLIEPSRQNAKLEVRDKTVEATGTDAQKANLAKARRQFVTTKQTKRWTRSHGNILKLLNEKRVQRMSEVDRRAAEMKAKRVVSVGEQQQQQQPADQSPTA